MITIYGVYRSRAARALWCAGEAGLAFDHVPVVQAYRVAKGYDAGGALVTDDPAFLAVNPQGQIPAMTDGDLTLTESMAITLYLAERGGSIGPQGGTERARMVNWALQAATGIEEAAVGLLQADPTDTARIDRLAQSLQRPLARLDAHLAGQAWMMGDRFTVADINTAECVRYAKGHATLMMGFPHLSAWLDRCHARPAFRDMWAAREREAA
jgi:glutathione S-transferase